jgi:hypothetical protein
MTLKALTLLALVLLVPLAACRPISGEADLHCRSSRHDCCMGPRRTVFASRSLKSEGLQLPKACRLRIHPSQSHKCQPPHSTAHWHFILGSGSAAAGTSRVPATRSAAHSHFAPSLPTTPKR